MLKRTIRLLILAYTAILICVLVVVLVSQTAKSKREYMDAGTQLINSYAFQKSTEIGTKLKEDLSITQTMAIALSEISQLPNAKRLELESNLMRNVLVEHPEYLAVFQSWRLNLIDKSWPHAYGRQRHNFFYSKKEINESINLTDTAYQEEYSGIFHLVKKRNELLLSDPYEFKDYDNSSNRSMRAISTCAPIHYNGKFMGIIGIDFDLAHFHKYSEVSILSGGYAYLVSNNGTLIAHPKKSLIGSNVSELGHKPIKKKGESIASASGVFDPHKGTDVFMSSVPITFSEDLEPWTMVIVVPMTAITGPIMQSLRQNLIYGGLIIGMLVLVLFALAKLIIDVLSKANHKIKQLAEGHVDIHDQLKLTKLDRYFELGQSANQLTAQLQGRAAFAQAIGSGDLNAEIEVTNEHDLLGISLMKMRDNLRDVTTEMQQIIQQASKEGIWSGGVSDDSKEGAWRELYGSINQLLRSVTIPLNDLNRMARELANGDLSTRFRTNAKGDILQLKENLNQAIAQLSLFLQQVVESASFLHESTEEMLQTNTEMTTNAKEIATAIGEMSRGAHEQVNKVDESSRLFEGILTSSKEIGTQAEEIKGSAKAVREKSESGTVIFKDVANSMKEILLLSNETSESMKALADRSYQISSALTVISDISTQTNLLALNAAIEASQAGDYGRGFAVIAEEIRKLAEMSKESARGISTLVSDIRYSTQDTSNVIQKMNGKITEGERTAQNASSAFHEIKNASVDNLMRSEQIESTIQSLIASINSVVNIAEGVVVIAEQTAAGAEEIASSATELSVGMDSYNDKATSLSVLAAQMKAGLEKFTYDPTDSEASEIYLKDLTELVPNESY